MSSKNSRVLIVGQGISGTLLSWFLQTHEVDFTIIDDARPEAPSQTAAGLINPVTGRRVVTVWLDELILPFAARTYRQMETFLNISAFSTTEILDFFPNPFMRESFLKKLDQKAPYIELLEGPDEHAGHFNYEFGAGRITPAYIVHLSALLPAWRQHLAAQNRLIQERFDFEQLTVTADGIQYGSHRADRLIFCDGVQGANNPYFSLLPFALNKGEALIIEAPELPADRIYKKSLTLAPFCEPGLFWAGTNYIWDFENSLPTESFRAATEQTLKSWLKLPFRTVDHKAAIRPATIERRPFVGMHPVFQNIGILNGMGTKGCSLAPYFAFQLVQQLLFNTPIERDADIQRHHRILARAAS